jgi:NAD(P)-dependent dehydrogenase (short-subunit alcohol dehydrogenase family)
VRGLQGHTAIVTGGATIIGQAVVRAFAEAGSNVVVADIDEQGGSRIADELGDNVRFVATDLRSDESCKACVAEAAEAYGSVDFLVNLAAVYVDEGFGSTREDWLESYNVNVVGGVMMLQAARPHMQRAGGGAVVNFGSISAKVAQTGRWLYPASKAAILQVTRSEAMDLAADGIRVNSVSPGWTWSSIMNELSGGDRAHTDAVGGEFHLLRRVADPEEVAQTVLFLCSEGASFITGVDIAVDGGYSAMGPERAEPAIPRLAAERDDR